MRHYYIPIAKVLLFTCFIRDLVESVSREIEEIRLSHSHQCVREIMHYSPPENNKKITCAITRTHDLWTAENRECFVNRIVQGLK